MTFNQCLQSENKQVDITLTLRKLRTQNQKNCSIVVLI